MGALRNSPILSAVVVLVVGVQGIVSGLLLFGTIRPSPRTENAKPSGVGEADRLTALSSGGVVSDRIVDGSEPVNLSSLAKLVTELEQTPDAELNAKLDALLLSPQHRGSEVMGRIVAEIVASRGDEFATQWLAGFKDRPGNYGIMPFGAFGELVALRPGLVEAAITQIANSVGSYQDIRAFTSRIAGRVDADKTVDLILANSSGGRSMLLDGFMDGVQANDPAKAWAIFERLVDDYPPEVVAQITGEVIAQRPGEVVAEYIDQPARHQLVKTGLERWGKADPAAAIEFYLANELWKRGTETLDYFSAGIYEADNVPSIRSALEQLESAPASRANYDLRGNLAIALMVADPAGLDEATQTLAEIPLGHTRHKVLNDLTYRLSVLDNTDLAQRIRHLQSTATGAPIAEQVLNELRRSSAARVERMGFE